MKSYLQLSTLALMGMAATAVHAQTVTARVVSSTPVVQQVSTPSQSCVNETVQGPKSGAGALLGGIAGGAAGNAIGDGSGRAAATILGIFGGAILGDRIEGAGAPRTVQRCSTQNVLESRVTAYNVVYELDGRQYSVQMPKDPGPTIQLQLSPVSQAPAQPQPAAPQVQTAPVTVIERQVEYVEAPVYVAPPQVVYVAPQPVYRAPPVTSITFSGGYHRGHGHHGHHAQPVYVQPPPQRYVQPVPPRYVQPAPQPRMHKQDQRWF
jgi:uncharacterized protein YcfJ